LRLIFVSTDPRLSGAELTPTAIPIFAIFYFGWKFWHKTTWVTLEAMDFHTGLQALDEVQEEEELRESGKTGFWHKVSEKVF
jgi:amino acid transporter